MSKEEYALLLQIKVSQAARALSDLSDILRQSNEGLSPDQKHQLWREFNRIDLVKEAA